MLRWGSLSDYRCKSAINCVARTSDGSAVATRDDSLCARCVEDLQRMLERLPGLAEMLKLFLGGSMKSALESRVSRTSEPQAPMNLHVADLVDEITDVVSRAGPQVHTLIQKPAEEATRWFKGKPRKVLLTGVDRALDIRSVHNRAETMIGLNQVWEKRVGPCPNPECRMPCLGNWSGTSTIICTACSSSFERDVYDAMCVAQSHLDSRKRKSS